MNKPPNIIYSALVGSHAYGLNGPDSDIDSISVFVRPTKEIWSWENNRNTYIDYTKGENDDTYYEIGHFLSLMYKGNFNIIEFFQSPKSTIFDPHFISLKVNQNWIFNQEAAKASMMGFLNSKKTEFYSKPNFNKKSLRTILMKSAAIESWLKTGEYNFNAFTYQMVEAIENFTQEQAIDLVESQIYRLHNTKITQKFYDDKARKFYTDFIDQIRMNFI